MKTKLKPDDYTVEEYRKWAHGLLDSVTDEKLIRRVWRLLTITYNEQ